MLTAQTFMVAIELIDYAAHSLLYEFLKVPFLKKTEKNL